MTEQTVVSNHPGSPTMPESLPPRLQEALVAMGPGYVPRTHHKQGQTPTYTNRLILETSPYLLQHAHNPVNWYPWGDEALSFPWLRLPLSHPS
jgi:hypothetical protein